MKAFATNSAVSPVTHVANQSKRSTKTGVIIMYALKLRNGDWARMSNGQRFVYSSRELAKRAARALAKTHGWTEIVDA